MSVLINAFIFAPGFSMCVWLLLHVTFTPPSLGYVIWGLWAVAIITWLLVVEGMLKFRKYLIQNPVVVEEVSDKVIYQPAEVTVKTVA